MNPEIKRLPDAESEARFGGKAASLSRALRAGLPVPDGFAISWEAVEAISRGHRQSVHAVLETHAALGGLVAVRSSAIGEDSAGASFAGQHVTKLGAGSPVELLAAIFAVFESAFDSGPEAYRLSKGIRSNVRIAVVVQRMVEPRSAGVLFTRNPVTGADERVVEAAWGLGEAVVASLVTPDRARIARGGRVLEHRFGRKTFSLHLSKSGGTERREVPPEAVEGPCLSDSDLARLDSLAADCERVFGPSQDLEWAFAGESIHLLQSRPITAGLR
jgi:pyruvate,water dikinase